MLMFLSMSLSELSIVFWLLYHWCTCRDRVSGRGVLSVACVGSVP